MLISLRGQVQRLSRSVIRYQPEVTCDLTNRTPRRLMSRRNWRKLFRNMWAKARHWVTVALNSKSSVLASRNSIIRYLILGFMKWTIQVSRSTCFQVTECYNWFPLFLLFQMTWLNSTKLLWTSEYRSRNSSLSNSPKTCTFNMNITAFIQRPTPGLMESVPFHSHQQSSLV